MLSFRIRIECTKTIRKGRKKWNFHVIPLFFGRRSVFVRILWQRSKKQKIYETKSSIVHYRVFRSFSPALVGFPPVAFPQSYTRRCVVRCWAEILKRISISKLCSSRNSSSSSRRCTGRSSRSSESLHLLASIVSYMTSTIIDVDVVCNQHTHTPNVYKCVYYIWAQTEGSNHHACVWFWLVVVHSTSQNDPSPKIMMWIKKREKI